VPSGFKTMVAEEGSEGRSRDQASVIRPTLERMTNPHFAPFGMSDGKRVAGEPGRLASAPGLEPWEPDLLAFSFTCRGGEEVPVGPVRVLDGLLQGDG